MEAKYYCKSKQCDYAFCLNKNKNHFYVFKSTIESPRFLTTGNGNSVWSFSW